MLGVKNSSFANLELNLAQVASPFIPRQIGGDNCRGSAVCKQPKSLYSTLSTGCLGWVFTRMLLTANTAQAAFDSTWDSWPGMVESQGANNCAVAAVAPWCDKTSF